MVPDNNQTAHAELLRLSDSGVPLRDAWIEFAIGFIDYRWALGVLEADPIEDARFINDPRFKQLEGWLPDTGEGRQQVLQRSILNERGNLCDEIYANRYWAIGVRTSTEELVRLDRGLFFVNLNLAEPQHIFWDRDTVMSRDAIYSDVKVASAPENAPSTRSATRKETATARRNGPGRPSERTYIKEAIAYYARDPNWFRSPPSDRYKSYYSHLSNELRFDVRNRAGFRSKTIAKYERQIRAQLRKPRPVERKRSKPTNK